MSKLERDTRLASTPQEGVFTAALHEDWQVWFPHGGYMAALLLRAVGSTSKFPRPVSQTCYFLSVPTIGAVDIRVTSMKRTRSAEALSFAMTQQDKPIIQGLAWTGTKVEGYEHEDAVIPDVPGPAELRSTHEIENGHAPHPFWNNFEQRPVSGNLHWHQAESGPAIQRDWLAFPEADEDAFLNAGRYLVLLDAYGWPAAARAHAGDGRYIAPTLSLNVDFHRLENSRWLLSDATCPVAQEGYMSARNRLWTESGHAVATAHITMMCRPRPGYSES